MGPVAELALAQRVHEEDNDRAVRSAPFERVEVRREGRPHR